MMKSKVVKKILISIIVSTMLMSLIYVNFGEVFADVDMIGEIVGGMEGVTSGTGDIDKIQSVINTVIGLFQIAGTGISIIVITMLGIKYMMASSGEKADVKKQAIPVVVGCVILVIAVNLVAIIADVGDAINDPKNDPKNGKSQVPINSTTLAIIDNIGNVKNSF